MISLSFLNFSRLNFIFSCFKKIEVWFVYIVYIKVIQIYYIYIFIFRFFSLTPYCKVLSTFPSALE